MDTILFFKFIILGFLLLLSSFFSGSETALFSLSRFQIKSVKDQKHSSIHFIVKLLEDQRRLIITILVGNELVNISASIVAASIFISILGDEGKWVAMMIMVPLILIFGEIIPKSVAFNYNIAFSLFVARPLMFFSKVIYPLRWMFKGIADIDILGIREYTHNFIPIIGLHAIEDKIEIPIEITGLVGGLLLLVISILMFAGYKNMVSSPSFISTLGIILLSATILKTYIINLRK